MHNPIPSETLKPARNAPDELGGAGALEFLAESLPNMIWTARPDGALDYFNQPCLDYFQRSHQQMKDWQWKDVLHPDDLNQCLERWSHSLETGEPYEFEFRLQRASDGFYRWHLVRALPRRDEKGRIVKWFGSCTDVHERKEAENRLRKERVEMEWFFQAFMKNNPAVAWMKDAAGRYVYVNDTLLRVYGVTSQEIIGSTDREVLPEAVACELQSNDQRVIESNRPFDTVERIPDARGRLRSWQICKFPFRDPDGDAYVGGLAFEITEKLEAEEAVQHSEEKFRSLVENARDAIFTLAPDGTFTTLNPAFEGITGWKTEDWLGRPFQPILHPDDLARAELIFAQSARGETPESFELRVATRDGGFVPLELTVTPHRIKGRRRRGVLGIARDIRQRRHLEEQIRQMQKLDSIGRLTAGIAHDFNNILTVQQGYISMLMMQGGLPEKVADNFHQIAQASERAAALTRQLLLFSRRQVMQSRPLCLDQVVHNLSKMLARALGEDIELDLEFDDDLPMVNADPGMLEQILMNLAVNARDAMPDGGRLCIATCCATLDEAAARKNPEARAGRFLLLQVKDNGHGIPEEALEHIFEPFYTTKEVGQGTGLGLPTVHGIVKQHQGWIEVATHPGEGTEFSIFLPAVQRQAEPGLKSEDKAELRRGSEVILAVEDEEPVRELVKTILESQGYQVLTAGSGVEALEIWSRSSTPIDLLLTDLVMPGGMTGHDLAQRLIKEKPSLKIVFTSGYSPEAVRIKVHDMKPAAFLQKPYPPEKLAKLVREVLDGQYSGVKNPEAVRRPTE